MTNIERLTKGPTAVGLPESKVKEDVINLLEKTDKDRFLSMTATEDKIKIDIMPEIITLEDGTQIKTLTKAEDNIETINHSDNHDRSNDEIKEKALCSAIAGSFF